MPNSNVPAGHRAKENGERKVQRGRGIPDGKKNLKGRDGFLGKKKVECSLREGGIFFMKL